MNPADIDRILRPYRIEEQRGGYAPVKEPASQATGRFFDLQKINGREIVVVRVSGTNWVVFRPVTSLVDIRAYLGEPPNDVIPGQRYR
jgi:hypothetical protein